MVIVAFGRQFEHELLIDFKKNHHRTPKLVWGAKFKRIMFFAIDTSYV